MRHSPNLNLPISRPRAHPGRDDRSDRRPCAGGRGGGCGGCGGCGDETEEDPCEHLEIQLGADTDWLRAWLTEERLKATCRKVVVDHGASYAQALLENIPMMMFFFLPVMALVMKLSYPLSGRYYVEHLLFLVHFHAFFYFILTLNLLAEWTFEGTTLPDWPAPLLATVTLIYVPVYLFKSMRLVYGQSRMVTLGKYALLGISYFVGLMTMFVITLTVTALTL